LEELLKWFEKNLTIPDRFAASKHPHARGTAISWIRASARDHLVRLRKMTRLLSSVGIPLEELRTQRPGYVIYEDDHQVVALPFADTPS
jgi:glycine cleavage system regulatory protein